MAAKPADANSSPEVQLGAFLARFDPKQQKVFGSIRSALRKRFPSANELADEYPDSVVVSYSPTERGSDGIVAIALRKDGIRLYLMNALRLRDPKRLLQATGKQARFVPLATARECTGPDVEALIVAAVEQAKVVVRFG